MNEGILIASSNRGRYAFDEDMGPPYPDITSGQPLDVYLGGRWIPGRIEHAGAVYVTNDNRVMAGYYFLAEQGGDCGLAVGMKVRIL
jgi:hypothetical protein